MASVSTSNAQTNTKEKSVSVTAQDPTPGPPSAQELEEAYRQIPQAARVGSVENPTGNFNPSIPEILPHEHVLSIQVGSELFKLSGASLSSDAPSYFTTFFLKHKDLPPHQWPTLYIDRSPKVFRMIVSHLQGYYVMPEDDVDYIYLMLDANYYHLPRLITQLSQSEIHIRIGCQPFRISRNIFNSPGNSPNFFTLGFSTFFGSDIAPPNQSFKRPPPIAPPTVPQRSGELFNDLLRALQGSRLEIKNEKHRQLLLAECRYYRFLGLEQTLISHSIQQNRLRGTEEIVLDLHSIRPKQMKFRKITDSMIPFSAKQFVMDKQKSQGSQNPIEFKPLSVTYKRPFADTIDRELIIQLNSSEYSCFEPAILMYTPASASTQFKSYWEVMFFDSAETKMKAAMTILVNGANKRMSKKPKNLQQSLKPENTRNSSEELSFSKTPERDGMASFTDDGSFSSQSDMSLNSSLDKPASIATGPHNGIFVATDDAYIMFNDKVLDLEQNRNYDNDLDGSSGIYNDEQDGNSRKRQRTNSTSDSDSRESETYNPTKPLKMIVLKSQWRILCVQGYFMFELLRCEGCWGQKYTNKSRAYAA